MESYPQKKLMKIVKALAVIVLTFAVLSFVAFSVLHVVSHGQMFGRASGLVIDFANFPRLAKDAIHAMTSPIRHYQLPVDRDFEHVNNLPQDLYTLESYYSPDASHLLIRLVNLKTNEVIHEWRHKRERSVIDGVVSNHPVLLDDYSVIFNLERVLYKIDANSNLVWKNDTWNFHHSLEFDHEGNLWVPATFHNGSKDINSRVVSYGTRLDYRDNVITKVDPATGEVLYSKAVSEMLLENNYPGLVYGFWQYDLVHVNDIQPVMTNTKYWQIGDVFLSCRNIHTVFLYRPSTGKIIWLRTGLWASQHDVDIADSTSITIFDNNVNTNYYDQIRWINKDEDPEKIRRVVDPIEVNVMSRYDFATDSAYSFATELVAREKIGTRSQGIFTALSNGLYFIEETDQGKIFIGNDQETVYKKQFISEDSTFLYYPGWTRVYEQIPTKKN